MATSHTQETRTTFTNLMKNVYAPSIIELTPEHSVLLSQLESRLAKTAWGGNAFIIPVEFNYMGSTGAFAEDGYLPDSLPGTWQQTQVPIKYYAFAVSVTDQLMQTSGSGDFGWVEGWARQLFIKSRAFRQHMSRIVSGDGNGILAQVDGAPSGTTITLDNAYGLSGYNNSDVNGSRFVSSNMKVDFYSGATIRDTGGVKITAFTRGTFPSTSATITASGTITEVTDGDYMYLMGAKGYEGAGIKLLVDDNTVASTVQSLSADTYSEWRSQMGYGSTPGTAEALTSLRMQSLMDDVESYGNGMVDLIYTSNGVYLTYGEMARSENLITNQVTLDTGWKGLEFMGVPIVKDTYCVDEMFFLDTSSLGIYQTGEAGWLDQDGSVLRLSPDRKANWEAYWTWYMSLGINNRAKNGKLVDISVTANKY